MSVLLVLLLVAGCAHSARILGVFPTPSISHQMVFQPIWRELAQRGHQVTIITPDPLKDNTLVNLTEIDVRDISYSIWRKHNVGSMGATKGTKKEGISAFIELYSEFTNAQLGSPQVQDLIHSDAKFDLILVEFLWPSFYAFKDIYNCPMIGVSSLPLGLGFHDTMGNPSHPVLHPDVHLPFSRNLSFKERLHSVVYSVMNRVYAKTLQPIFTDQIKQYFPNVTRTSREIGREISLVFTNVNPALNVPRPNVPGVVEISGLHIQKEKSLPKDLKAFLDTSKRGVIYFSLGSNVQSSQLPKEKINVILETFREMPYDVLWKYELEHLEVPKNVKIMKWLPQQDVLRHKNVKVFITQGGLQSIEEAIYYQVPLVAMPFFADQPGNARKIEEIGIGKKLDFLTLDKEQLSSTIREVMNNEKYKTNIAALSKIVKDQQISGLEKVIWWTEYVLRHDGAPHLRSPAIDLPLYQYFLLDVISVITISVSLIIYIFIKLTKKLLNLRTRKEKVQ